MSCQSYRNHRNVLTTAYFYKWVYTYPTVALLFNHPLTVADSGVTGVKSTLFGSETKACRMKIS